MYDWIQGYLQYYVTNNNSLIGSYRESQCNAQVLQKLFQGICSITIVARVVLTYDAVLGSDEGVSDSATSHSGVRTLKISLFSAFCPVEYKSET